MKTIQFLGNKSKADFLIYLAHSLAALKKRVLIVDITESHEYFYGYIRETTENEVLYDFNGIEILTNAKGITNIELSLKEAGEQLNNFDYVLIDTDRIHKAIQTLEMNETYYVSDNIRTNVMKDIELLNDYADLTGKTNFQQIHFENSVFIGEEYINVLSNNRFTLSQSIETFEQMDNEDYLKQFMQIEGTIPFNKVSKQYKQKLKLLAAEITLDSTKEFDVALKQSFFSRLFGKRNAPTVKALPSGEQIKEG